MFQEAVRLPAHRVKRKEGTGQCGNFRIAVLLHKGAEDAFKVIMEQEEPALQALCGTGFAGIVRQLCSAVTQNAFNGPGIVAFVGDNTVRKLVVDLPAAGALQAADDKADPRAVLFQESAFTAAAHFKGPSADRTAVILLAPYIKQSEWGLLTSPYECTISIGFG